MDYYGYETTDLPVSMQYNSKEFEFQYRYDG